MNVLHVIPSLHPAQGGLRTALAGFCAALATAGIHSTIAAVDDGDDRANDGDFGAIVHRFAPSRPKLTRNSAALAAWLAAHMDEFDAVITHSLWLTPTRLALEAAHKAGVRAFAHPHGMLDPDALKHHAWRKLVRWNTGEARSLKHARLLFSTDEELNRARTRAAVKALPASVVPNAVDAAFFGVKREAAGKPPRILCLNRLHPRKGVRELIGALLLLHKGGVDFHATLAGADEDTAYSASVRQLAGPLAQKVKFAGLRDRGWVLDQLAKADLIVHPSTGYENFGMVAAEAMAAGVAVVASRRALLTPQLERAKAAFGVEPNAEALAIAIEKLLGDAAARSALAEAGRRYAREHFTVHAVGKQLAAVLSRH
ncbi:MAG: glycosyltransferase [Planctomycetes bacterium]|nr:glycosyltransferase [Planctomycetota bacterium]